jgi:hypothetical protein
MPHPDAVTAADGMVTFTYLAKRERLRGLRVQLDRRRCWVGYSRGRTRHHVCPIPCVVISWRRRLRNVGGLLPNVSVRRGGIVYGGGGGGGTYRAQTGGQ